MAADLRKDPETHRGGVRRIAEQLGIHTETMRDWVKKAEIDDGTRPGVTTAETAHIQELEREVRELWRANQILKSSAAFSRRSSTAHHDRRESGVHRRASRRARARTNHSRLGRRTPAQIAPSSYYAARSRPCSARSFRDAELSERITRIHAASYGVYGARNVHAALRREGYQVAESSVRRLMPALGLRGISWAKGPRSTKPAPETDRPRDLVDRVFTASRRNELWVADITYVNTFSGWVNTAFVLDVYSHMIVGW